jgi:hypothetical protein
MLSEQQVVEIYMAKIALRAQSRDNALDANKVRMLKGQSIHVSAIYGVTSRTIRDIWNRQSWAYATRHLWHLERDSGIQNKLTIAEAQVLLFFSFFWRCLLVKIDLVDRAGKIIL